MKQLFNSSPDELQAYEVWKALVAPLSEDINLCSNNIDRWKNFGEIFTDTNIVPIVNLFESEDFSILYGVVLDAVIEWGGEAIVSLLMNFFTSVYIRVPTPMNINATLGYNMQEVEDSYAIFEKLYPVQETSYWMGDDLVERLYILFRKVNRMRLTGTNLQVMISKSRPVGELWTIDYEGGT